jgi:hypothetical protein
VIDARRLAQIGVFLFGLSQLGALISVGLAFAAYFEPNQESHLGSLLVPLGYGAFVLSLILLSGGWASLVNVPGSVATFSQLNRDDLLRVGVALLGLYFLITGVSGVVASLVTWLQGRSLLGSYEPLSPLQLLETASLVRALAGAALVLWGTNVVAFIQWLRGLGGTRGAA